MFTCRERKGCPASFYLDPRCPVNKGKNCWELAEGCPLTNCGKNCKDCRAFYASRGLRVLKKINKFQQE